MTAVRRNLNLTTTLTPIFKGGTMHLKIENILGHQALEVDLEPGCTLVTGKHSAGKTSLAQALACLASHKLPGGLSAAEGKFYVYDGKVEGRAALGDVVWSPPKPPAIPPGVLPIAPPHAVGIVDFTKSMNEKSRAELWEGVFLPSDPASILRPKWTLPEKQLVAILDEIDKRGWDKACQYYTDQRREAKRKWERTTKARYGSERAVNWRPDAWKPELEGESLENLQSVVSNAQDALRAITVQDAITQDRIDRGLEAQKELVGLKRSMDGLNSDFNNLKKELLELQDKAKAERNRVADHSRAINKAMELLEGKEPDLKCPECGAGLELIQAGMSAELKAHKPLTEAEKTDLETQASDLRGQRAVVEDIARKCEAQVKEARDQLVELSDQRKRVQSEIAGAERVAKDANLNVREASGQADQSKAENVLRAAKEDLDAFEAMWSAKRDHEAIIELDNVIALLGPQGARSEWMSKRMDAVRAVLANVSKKTGWGDIGITDRYMPIFNSRSVVLCAHNERLKVQWALQIASAMLWPECQVCILDAAELRDDSMDGLITLCDAVAAKREGLHILTCITEMETPEGWNTVAL